MGAIKLAKEVKMPYDLIIKAMSFGFIFRATDESGNPYTTDKEFLEAVASDFVRSLTGLLNLQDESDHDIIEKLQNLYLAEEG
jgi:hypothetical protein